MSESQHILLVEDEPNFGSVLSQFLEMHGFQVTWAKDGAEAWGMLKSTRVYDCCVLDVMMPEIDGFTLGKEIKATKPGLPFIYLTAKSMKKDMVEGFQTGADDYITKPFDSEILVYKLKALLSRGTSPVPKATDRKLQIGSFQYDPELRTLHRDNQEQRLSPKENGILHILATHLNEVVTREELVASGWEEDNYFTRRSMDVYMSKLRKYLQADPSIQLTSVHAGGYQLSCQNVG
jgi:DNA-binding response OmpR family regulator